MVEYIREPKYVAINDGNPKFAWIVPSEAVSQNAYQILVASSKQKIDNNLGDVWNSGQIRKNISSNVKLQGKPLNPNSKYFWKVRIWDQDNRLTNYSEAQEFKTGTFKGYISTGNAFYIERISPKSIVKTSAASYFVDFGKDAFGTLELTYNSPKTEILTVRFGERLDDGGGIDRNPEGTIRYSEVKLAVQPGKRIYTLKQTSDQRNTLPNNAVQLPDSFDVVTPFRYVEIDNYKSGLTKYDLSQKAYFNYFDEKESSFSSSDTTLNQIWDLCKYSIKATTFSGFYIDGDRERIPYEADAYINQLGHYSVDREYAMARQTIEWFMEKPTWPTEWLLHTALLMYQDYMYTGDTELLKKYYNLLKSKCLMQLSREDGLISTQSVAHNGQLMLSIGFADSTQRMKDIVDWPAGKISSGGQDFEQKGERDGYEMVPINTVVNSFFYKNMLIMADFAGILGKAADQDEFSLMAAKVKQSINNKLFDQQKEIYLDGESSFHSSLHANMWPLAFGIVPEKYKKSVVDFVKSRKMACSVYGAQYLFEGLYEAGEGQYALDLLRATDDRSYWNMIKVGSNITMEAWDMKYKPNSDWNHAWGAAPANIIPRQMWGIQPETPGFELVRIKPQLGDLKNSSITVPTIKGAIKASYKFVNARKQNYEIELPANVGGDLFVPDNSEAVVTINGQKVNPSFKSIRLEPGMNRVEIVIN